MFVGICPHFSIHLHYRPEQNFTAVGDKFLEMLLFEVDCQENLFHDECVHEGGIQLVEIFLGHISIIAHDADGDGVLFALLGSLFEGITDGVDFCENALDFGPIFGPLFVVFSCSSQKMKMESTWDMGWTRGTIC